MSRLVRLLANIGLQKRILLSVAAGLVAAIGGLGLVSVHFMNESTDHTLDQQLSIAQVAASHVDSTVQTVSLELQSASSSFRSDFHGRSLQRDQDALTGAYLMMSSLVNRLMLIDQNGKILLVVPAESSLVDLDYSSRPHVQRTLATGQPAVATAFTAPDNGRAGIAVTAPIRDQSGQLIGLISGEIDLARPGPANFTSSVKVGGSGFFQLVDENGLILASTEPAKLPPAVDGENTVTTHPEHFPSLIRDGQPVVRVCHSCHQTAGGLQRGRDIMAFAPLANAPFGVALRLKEDDVFGTSHNLQRTVAGYGLFVLGLGLFFAWLTTSAVVKPLEALTVAARRIGGGDLDSPIALTVRPGISETTTLAATLEAMRRRLHASYDRIERLNRGLEDRVAQRTRELSILFEVSQTLTRTVDVDALMQTVVEKIVSVLDAADAALLFRFDRSSGLLIPRAAVGYRYEPLQEVSLLPGEAMAGKVLEAGRPLLFPTSKEVRAALDGMSPGNAGLFRQARAGLAQPEAAVGAPIVFEGEVVGVLLLVNLRQQSTFDANSDIALVQALADQVAVAIEHSRLVQEAGQVQALREADRLKSEFLYNVSHELRTPLSSIVSLADVLSADHRTIPRRQLGQVLAILGRSAARMKEMVENLLDAGTIQAGRFRVQKQPSSFSSIVQEAINVVQPLLDAKQQEVDFALPERDLIVSADRHRIVQVLVNLLSNANKYCPSGQCFHLAATVRDQWAVFTLADDGPGVAPEDQAHLFEPFYRGSRPLSVAGAGLGLAIVKAIVEAHGGQVSFESKIGVGTTVVFTLPLLAGNAADDSMADAQLVPEGGER